MKKYNILICPIGAGANKMMPAMLRDIKEALEQLGHTTAYLPLVTHENKFDYQVAADFCTAFKPTFAIMIGMSGIIPMGDKLHFLDRENIPYYQFFFDFPLAYYYKGRYTYHHLKATFIWDYDYVDSIGELGFRNVFYLPIGTNPKRFLPIKRLPETVELSFVGYITDEYKIIKALEVLSVPDKSIFDATVSDYLKGTESNLLKIIEKYHLLHYPGKDLTDNENFVSLYKLAEAWLTTHQRKQIIYRLASKYKVVVFGNAHWDKLKHRNIIINPVMPYDQLSFLYNVSKINLNITASHLSSSINQRLFDVGATQSFILTDYRKSLPDFFDETEVIYYKNRNDIIDIVEHYLSQNEMRVTISENMRKKVLAKHTWVHRMKSAMDIIGQLCN